MRELDGRVAFPILQQPWRITAPTLIIESKYDGSMDASHASYAADHLPNAELFVSPAESHLLRFSSYNAAIEEKMRAFLQASRVSW